MGSPYDPAVLPPLTLSGWHRYDLVRNRLAKWSVSSILEIGPGLGGIGARFAVDYEYVGAEVDPASAEIARERLAQARGGRIVTGTAKDVGRQFDVVCAFEVLEHVEDDEVALTEWREQVRPGGWLVLSVPAWQHRWGAHDEHAGHFRRYDRESLEALVARTGFSDVDVVCYGFPLLSALHPLWNALSARARREDTLEERTHASGRFRQPPRWAGTLTHVVAAPFIRLQRLFVDSDHGTGFVVFAQRAD
jgi:SAM-dependent methyltransferase